MVPQHYLHSIFSVFTVILWVNYPCVMKFHMANVPCAFLIHVVINPVYFRPIGDIYPCLWFYIRSGFHMSPVTSVRHEAPNILGNPVIFTFLELMGSNLPQHTPVVKPWIILSFLSWLQSMICSRYWYCLSFHVYFFRYSCGISHIFISTFIIFVANCSVHQFRY